MEQDQRFSHIVTDPKFRRIPKGERKVKIDKRFKSMFKDKQFKIKYTTDKRGRPVNHTSNEDLKRYYELSSEESASESENEGENEIPGKYVRAPDSSPSDDEQSDSNQLDVKYKIDKQISDKVKKRLRNLNIDYARGESTLYSESSSDDEESDEDEEEALEHAWGELDRDAERTDEITHRLAACNMDWDRIRAVDLMILLNSFLPPGGLIKSVTIYPSQFGLQRMKEEEVKGPTELVESKFEEDENENEEGSKYHMEKLRQYQLNRLKYYYAVIVCDNKNTANKIYTECDGLEYESSATKMDLRFIPDDVTFDEEPKEVCEKLPEPGKYQPRFFTTTALQQAKVDLTWDETNPDRIEITQKLAAGNNDEIGAADLHTYLASSSGEESADEKENEQGESDEDSGGNESEKVNPIEKYKALLQDIESQEKAKNEKDVEMEISWGIDLKEKTEKLVKKKLDEKEEKTPFQQYLDKRKEKQKAKREERRKKHQDEEGDGSDSDIPSDIDMNDPYFAEELNKTEFKQKKKVRNDDDTESEDEQKKAELELLLLNSEDNKKHFSLQKIQERESNSKTKKKSKWKKNQETNEEQEDDFKINVEDARFSALYSSHHFNLDPTDSHYKKTKGMEAIVNEKLKRRTEVNDSTNKKQKTHNVKRDAELSVLVKSVKRNTENLGKKKKNK